MMKKIVSLHGSYFMNNFGDILLMKMFTQWIREYSPDVTVNYPLLKKNRIIDAPDGTTSGLRNLLRSDALVFFGGGYFGENPAHKHWWSFRNFYRHATVALLAIVFHIPYAVFGVEFGPLSVAWFRKVVVFIAKHADCILVRNTESLHFLKEHGIKNARLSCDAVLSLSDFVKPKMDSGHPDEILLHINRHNSQAIALINAIIAVLKEKNINHVGVLEDEPEQLSHHIGTIAELFEKANIRIDKYDYEGTHKVVEMINHSDMVFTTKLHVGITGIALNKKVFAAYIHPKTFRFHKQVNNQENCVSLHEVDDTIVLKIRDFFKQDRYTLPEQILETARDNKTALYAFLNAI